MARRGAHASARRGTAAHLRRERRWQWHSRTRRGRSLGADGAAVAEAVAVPDVDGTEVLALDAVVPEGFAVVEAAGEAGAWKSVQVSVRNVSPFAVTLNAVVVTVYFTPSLLTT